MTSRKDSSATAVTRHWAASSALLLALWLAMLLAGGNPLDRWTVVNAHVGDGPWLTPVLLITRLGDWEVLMAFSFFAAAWLMLQGRRRQGLLLLGLIVIGRLLVELQKFALGRVRPDLHEALINVETYAFPSGHAANSMIVYLLLALVLIGDQGRRRLAAGAAILLSLLIGISRVLLGVHWPSDVIGGWAFGLFWVLLTLRALRAMDGAAAN